MTQDQSDFMDAMDGAVGPTLATAIRTLVKNNGADPRLVANALERAAETARGWCTGRFGA